MKVDLKLRVTSRNPEHVHVAVFDRLDGEGDVPDRAWQLCGELVFGTRDWDRELATRFEAMGLAVEETIRARQERERVGRREASRRVGL